MSGARRNTPSRSASRPAFSRGMLARAWFSGLGGNIGLAGVERAPPRASSRPGSISRRRRRSPCSHRPRWSHHRVDRARRARVRDGAQGRARAHLAQASARRRVVTALASVGFMSACSASRCTRLPRVLGDCGRYRRTRYRIQAEAMRARRPRAPLLPACIIDGPDPGPGVVGSPTDVVTIPGDHGGYRVVLTCANAWNDAGVIGRAVSQ